MSLTIAVCLIISFFPIFRLPLGGSVTIGKMLPLIFFTYFYDLKSGILAGATYSILQIIMFFHIPPAKTPWIFALTILLDYIIPYLTVGFIAAFKTLFQNKKKYFITSIIFSYFIRFLCSTASGIIIWYEYIPKRYNIWLYCVVYNLIYIVPETLIALIVCNILLNFFVLKNTTHTL